MTSLRSAIHLGLFGSVPFCLLLVCLLISSFQFFVLCVCFLYLCVLFSCLCVYVVNACLRFCSRGAVLCLCVFVVNAWLGFGFPGRCFIFVRDRCECLAGVLFPRALFNVCV